MQIRILVNGTSVYSCRFDGTIELGRQRIDEPAPYHCSASELLARIVIAPCEDTDISRRSLIIEPLSENVVRLCNVSSSVPLGIGDRVELLPGREAKRSFPLLIDFGNRQIELSADSRAHEDDQNVQHLPARTRLPSYEDSINSLLVQSRDVFQPQEALQWEQVVEWLRSAVNVLQIAASSEEFFQTASEAAVGMVGLDSGRVLVYQGDDWHVQAAVTRDDQKSVDWQASRSVLNRVKTEKRTFWKTSAELGDQLASLVGFSSVVAAPILDNSGEVIAVLYGDRKIQPGDRDDKALTVLDATLMELLASGIAAGLARVEQERTALAAQARFEEFFTPRLSKRLMNDSSLLEGQEREVTILFCDIRRFSQITERFGPSLTVGWLNDVLGVLSEEILKRDGVLVDYSGDQVMAMWGAPEEQPNHAQQACDAALAILKQLPALNERSSSLLQGETIDVGIGIDTGRAFVGNIGSHRKFKYGALGNTVNLASRIQGATKYFQCQLLISDATLAVLSDVTIEQQTRRVGQVKVVNIQEPVSLHELVPLDSPDFADRKTLLETFQEQLSDQKNASAIETLHNCLSKYPDDGPAQAYHAQLSNRTAVGDLGIQAGGEWILPAK